MANSITNSFRFLTSFHINLLNYFHRVRHHKIAGAIKVCPKGVVDIMFRAAGLKGKFTGETPGYEPGWCPRKEAAAVGELKGLVERFKGVGTCPYKLMASAGREGTPPNTVVAAGLGTGIVGTPAGESAGDEAGE